ncbi:MAG: methyl-accepting chemotaxis protein [Rhodomicrobiaceae bacterium]
MWNDIPLKAKIPALVLGAALIVGIGIGVSSNMTASHSIETLSHDRMLARAQTQKEAIALYLEDIRKDLVLIASNGFTIAALKDFTNAFSSVGGDTTQTLKERYIAQNPNPLGQKHLLDKATSGDTYDETHGRYHPWFRSFLTERGYYDIFLFDLAGNLVYTVFKEEDYATNFREGGGAWADSDLGRAFRAAQTEAAGSVDFFDFKPYGPSHGAPASFISTPVHEGGNAIGVLVFQMPIDSINAIMNSDAGLGGTGEVVLVGRDGLLRNDSRFTEQNDILKSRIPEDVIEKASAEGMVTFSVPDYRPLEMRATAVPFEFAGANFSVLAMQGVDEINEPVRAMGHTMLITSLTLLCLVSVAAFLFSRSISLPITRITASMRGLAEGNTQTDTAGSQDRKDEIGDMSRAVEVFRQGAIEREHLEKAARATRETENRRQLKLEENIRNFTDTITENFNTLLSAVSALRTTSQALVAAAEQGGQEASSSANSCAEAASSAHAVAAATEELNASIREIATQANHTSTIVGDTTQKAETTDQEVAKLTEAVNKIDSVVTLIRTIAQQTNLLALNATIESARAGEAGRGFAVVAAEVKALSEQTSKATEDIAQQIQTVQLTTGAAAEAIRAIGSQVGEIHTLASSVAAAVEEQEAATADIARNVHISATGSERAAESAQIVTQVSEKTGSEAQRVSTASDQLQAVSNAISKAIQDFIEAMGLDLEDRRASSRISVDKAIIVTRSGEWHEARAFDVSTTGMKISTIKGVNLNDVLEVDFGVEKATAKVVRMDANGVGLQFLEPLSNDQITSLARKEPGKGRRAA